MTQITMLLIAAGVMLSTIGGLIHEAGAGSLYGSLDWLPQSEMLFANPGVAFLIGVGLVVTGLICQPRRLA